MAEGTRSSTFCTRDGRVVPAVTADQMREVDRIAVEDFGLSILQMMENAGRTLAQNVLDMLGEGGQLAAHPPAEEGWRPGADITVLAGSGGNGGGGLCCVRHLHNRGFRVRVVLSRGSADLGDAAAHQLRVLRAAGMEPVDPSRAEEVIGDAPLVVDALIGYSLRGAPRGRVAGLIDLCNERAARVLSLDLPSGLEGTTGEAPGAVVQAERVLTLALPKTGLRGHAGELFLADIGIPPAVYRRLGLSFEWPSARRYWLPLED